MQAGIKKPSSPKAALCAHHQRPCRLYSAFDGVFDECQSGQATPDDQLPNGGYSAGEIVVLISNLETLNRSPRTTAGKRVDTDRLLMAW